MYYKMRVVSCPYILCTYCISIQIIYSDVLYIRGAKSRRNFVYTIRKLYGKLFSMLSVAQCLLTCKDALDDTLLTLGDICITTIDYIYNTVQQYGKIFR